MKFYFFYYYIGFQKTFKWSVQFHIHLGNHLVLNIKVKGKEKQLIWQLLCDITMGNRLLVYHYHNLELFSL